MDQPTVGIDELRAIQRANDLGHVHLAYVGPTIFTLAHTDDERATLHPLTDCALHQWASGLDGLPVQPGIYVATPHEPDQYSEPYGAAPWDFYPLTLWTHDTH